MKRKAVLALTMGSVMLAGFTSSNADDVFIIGTKEDGRAEFFDDQPPNGTLLSGCPENGTTNDGNGTFIYGANVDGDFPGFLVTPDATSTNWKPYSCQNVEILFSLDQACVNGSLNYGRYGGEQVDLYFNGEKVAETVSEENTQADFENPIDGFLLPGDYSVELKAITRNGRDGQAANDYVQLTCDPLAVYAKVSGRIDDPTATRGRGAPLVTFYGQVGKTVSGEVVGSVEINYKDWQGLTEQTCVFTPISTSSIDTVSDTSGLPLKVNLRSFQNSCDSSTTRLTIYDKQWDGTTPFCNNENGRGCIGVVGPGSYRISEGLAAGSGDDTNSADIDAGNGIVVVY